MNRTIMVIPPISDHDKQRHLLFDAQRVIQSGPFSFHSISILSSLLHLLMAVRAVISEAMRLSFPATNVVSIDPHLIDDSLLLQHVIPILTGGDIVALPTETVYGLAGNALDYLAVSRIFQAKGRPSDNPLIVHISNMEQLQRLVAPSALPQPGSLVQRLCDRFWPGPLTIVFPKHESVPDNVTGGQPHVAIRMPSHPIARRIIELSGLPLAAPSANRSGRPSPTCAAHVLEDLGREKELPEGGSESAFVFGQGTGVGCIVDGGYCDVGVESTVVRAETFEVLRPGTVTLEQLRTIDERFHLFGAMKHVHKATEDLTEEEKEAINVPSTPGLKYTHYAPSAPVILFEFTQPWTSFRHSIVEYVQKRLREEPQLKLALLHVHEDLIYEDLPSSVLVYPIGSTSDPAAIARALFAAFRDLDGQSIDEIVMEGVEESNEGLAVMNRARKAARTVIEPST